MKILVALGTRPEAIKLAPVALALGERSGARPIIVASGQHREMASEALAAFGLAPDVDLACGRPDPSLAGLHARLLEGFDREITRIRPDWVVVQGDTATALAAAQAAYWAGLPVAHVEAGLRSEDLDHPFPEESNRRAITLCARRHFAPTLGAASALIREGVAADDVLVTGNTGVDAVLWMRSRTDEVATLGRLGLDPGRRRVLVTAHRRESIGEPLADIARAVSDLAALFPDVDFVWPQHPNPSVTRAIEGGLTALPNVSRPHPLDYPAAVALLASATLALTDSGGLQEEGPALGVPVLVLRETTERPEGLRTGAALLVGRDAERIRAVTAHLLADEDERRVMAAADNPYGDGFAGLRIAGSLAEGPPARRALAGDRTR